MMTHRGHFALVALLGYLSILGTAQPFPGYPDADCAGSDGERHNDVLQCPTPGDTQILCSKQWLGNNTMCSTDYGPVNYPINHGLCQCINGNFCCIRNGGESEVSGGQKAVDYYKQNNCNCDGPSGYGGVVFDGPGPQIPPGSSIITATVSSEGHSSTTVITLSSPVYTVSTTSRSGPPQQTVLPAAGPGTWGTAFFTSDICEGTANYGGFNNTPLPCFNLATAKDWQSILLTKSEALQVRLYTAENCDSSQPCSVYNGETSGTCVSNIDNTSGNFFARSIEIIENPTDDGGCSLEG